MEQSVNAGFERSCSAHQVSCLREAPSRALVQQSRSGVAPTPSDDRGDSVRAVDVEADIDDGTAGPGASLPAGPRGAAGKLEEKRGPVSKSRRYADLSPMAFFDVVLADGESKARSTTVRT